MPGGKVTIKHEVPDLESYLARKRYPLDKWLLANNVTSVEALESLISSNKWFVSSELQHLIHELVKPVSVPVKAFVQAESVPPAIVVVEQPIVVEPVLEQVIEQPILNVEDEVVSVAEEPILPIEEVSVVSSQSNKERKKSR